MNKPENMTDEQCGALPAWEGLDGDGNNSFLTAWQPNKEDIEAINAGKPVFIKIVNGFLPPHQVMTIADDGTIN